MTMERRGMGETCQNLTRDALRSAETDRVAPGLDEYWILHTVDNPALRGALRRQLFLEWLQVYASRTS